MKSQDNDKFSSEIRHSITDDYSLKSNDCSLVIVAHRTGPMLKACFKSVHTLTPKPREVIIAIDGNVPEIGDAASALGFRYIMLTTQPGVSASRNAGAASAHGSVLIFVDSDVELPVNFINTTVAAFNRFPEVSAIIGSYDDDPKCPNYVSRFRNLLHHFTHQQGACEAKTFWGACGAIKRNVFIDLNGFDEEYQMPSIEDIELGYRLIDNGCHIRLVRDWQVKHLKTWSIQNFVLTDIRQRAFPWTLILLRRGQFDNDLNTDMTSRISAALAVLSVTCLLAGLFWPIAFLPLIVVSFVFVLINLQFYKLLSRSGNWIFLMISLPLYLTYFVAAVIGFAGGVISYILSRNDLR